MIYLIPNQGGSQISLIFFCSQNSISIEPSDLEMLGRGSYIFFGDEALGPWGWRRPSLGMDWISWPIQKSAETASSCRKREAYGTGMHMDIRCQWQILPRGWVQQIQQCSPAN